MRRLFTLVLIAASLMVGAGQAASAARGTPIRAVAFRVDATVPLNRPLNPACVAVHNQSECGNAVATLTLKGFAAYGGIAPCPAAGCSGFTPTDQFGRVGEHGRARLVQLYRCGATGPVRFTSIVVSALPIWQGVASGVNTATRIDADTARVKATFPFPNPHTYSPCPTDTRILAAIVYDVSVDYTGGGGVAGRTFRSPGYFWATPLP